MNLLYIFFYHHYLKFKNQRYPAIKVFATLFIFFTLPGLSHAQSLEALKKKLSKTTDSDQQELLKEAIADQTTDALEAFDLWFELATTAKQKPRQQTALEKTAVLALMLGEKEKALRLLKKQSNLSSELQQLVFVLETMPDRQAPLQVFAKQYDLTTFSTLTQWLNKQPVCTTKDTARTLLCP